MPNGRIFLPHATDETWIRGGSHDAPSHGCHRRGAEGERTERTPTDDGTLYTCDATGRNDSFFRRDTSVIRCVLEKTLTSQDGDFSVWHTSTSTQSMRSMPVQDDVGASQNCIRGVKSQKCQAIKPPSNQALSDTAFAECISMISSLKAVFRSSTRWLRKKSSVKKSNQRYRHSVHIFCAQILFFKKETLSTNQW
jgi:hypothetical protein